MNSLKKQHIPFNKRPWNVQLQQISLLIIWIIFATYVLIEAYCELARPYILTTYVF